MISFLFQQVVWFDSRKTNPRFNTLPHDFNFNPALSVLPMICVPNRTKFWHNFNTFLSCFPETPPMLLLYILYIYFFQISGSIRVESRIIEVQNPRGFEYIFVIIVVFAINQYVSRRRGIRVARELRSDRDGSGRGVTISGVIGEKRRREGVSGLQFRPRLGCLSRVHYCTDNQAVPGSRGREKGDGGSWGWFKRV